MKMEFIKAFEALYPGELATLEERRKVEAAAKYFCGKSLNTEELTLLMSRKQDTPSIAIALPRVFVLGIMPEFAGKALPVNSVSGTGVNLVQGALIGEAMLRPPGEPPAIFPRTFRLPVPARSGGKVTWPKLKEAAPAAEGVIADKAEFAEYGEAVAAWRGDEGAQAQSSEPLFDMDSISACEVSSYTEVSRQLYSRVASSGVEMIEVLRTIFRPAILHKIDEAIIAGNGLNGRPQGYLANANIGVVNRANANQVAHDDLVELEMALPPQYRANAAYVMSNGALKYLRKLKDAQGQPLYPKLGGPTPTLNEYPVIASQRLPALGTAGDVSFGDFSQYICPVEDEFTIAVSTEKKADQGIVCCVAWMNVGGKVVRPRAFSKLN